jgi:DNA-binding transcriptional LysR family regulator
LPRRSAPPHAHAAAGGLQGVVRLGHAITAAYQDVPRLLATVHQRHPHLNVQPREDWPPALIRDLNADQLDVVLGRHLSTATDERGRLILRREKLVAVLARSHRAARQPAVWLRELADQTFTFFPRRYSPRYHDFVLDAIARSGTSFEVWENPTPGLRHLGLRNGAGFTLLPASVAAHLAGDLAAVPIRDQLPPVELELLWKAASTSTRTEALIDAARALAGSQGWLP